MTPLVQALRRKLMGLTGARPGELGAVLGLFSFNFLIITSYLILKPVRNSLFLDYLGAENLPYAYIGTALFVGAAVWCYFRLLDSLSRTQVIFATWTFLGLGQVAFWFAFAYQGVVTSALLYFFSAVYAVTGVTQFWSFCSDVLDARQAKRLYGFVNTGALLGGLMGGFLTSVLAPRLGTEQLLLVSASLCAVNALLGATLSRRLPSMAAAAPPAAAASGEEEAPVSGGLQTILASRHLLIITGIIFLFQIVTTLIDFEFSWVVARAFPEKDARTAFFGAFTICLNTSSVLVNVMLTSRIHQRFGIGPALAVMPTACFMTSSVFLIAPVFVVGCFMKATSAALDYSIDRASRELLWQPTRREEKYKAKAFIDMFCFRFFRCLAGLLILAVGASSLVTIRILSGLVVVAAGCWFVATRSARREYVRQVRHALCGRFDPMTVPTLAPGLRRPLEVHLGFEARRYLTALEASDRPGLELGRQRMLALMGEIYGEDDVAAFEAGRQDPATRPLAFELMDNVADRGVGRWAPRLLDDQRSLSERVAAGSRLLAALGQLPRRPVPRSAWDVGPAMVVI